MEKGSALYQLMGIHMNSVMNGIANSDGEYQEIIRKSDEYSGKFEELELPEEIRLLIDRYVSEQNALGSRYGMLAYLLGFSDCREMLLNAALCPVLPHKYRQFTAIRRAAVADKYYFIHNPNNVKGLSTKSLSLKFAPKVMLGCIVSNYYLLPVSLLTFASIFSFDFSCTRGGDILAIGCILPTTGRIRDLHPLERAPAGRTRKNGIATKTIP